VRKDSSRFRAHVVIDPIRGPDGGITGFAKITRDLTERYEAEERLRLSQEQLELTREALVQTQKMEAIGQLTGGVAHDFNNLLMAVLGSLELLKKRLPADAGMRRLVDNAILGAQRGTSLTQRMLAFARRQDMKTAPVPLTELLNGMKGLLAASLGERTMVELQIPAELPAVVADDNQLSLAILNLSVNARDAMPEGGTVTISAEDAALHLGNDLGLEPGRYVRLAVSDTGLGMDPGTLARATEPYFTTKGVGKGTGLGLSMVQGMTEQLGGKFLLTSRRDQGTRAEMWLRVAVANAPAAKPGAPARRVKKKLRVLAVDDDRLVLFNTVEMLRDMGHTVSQVGSGRAALNLMRREHVDLLVTDQVMPKMTGAQLIERIRRTHPAFPAVLVTGYSDAPPASDPAIFRLNKPFTQEQLRGAIEVLAAEVE